MELKRRTIKANKRQIEIYRFGNTQKINDSISHSLWDDRVRTKRKSRHTHNYNRFGMNELNPSIDFTWSSYYLDGEIK